MKPCTCTNCRIKRAKAGTPKIHFFSLRLRNNAGMDFPLCYANAELLDLSKARLPMTWDGEEVSCLHCMRRVTTERPRGAGGAR